MRMKNIILIASLVLFVGIVSCKKDHEIPTGKVFNSELGGDTITPGGSGHITVTTSNVTNITPTTARGGGNVIVDGGTTVGERGICWSTHSSPNHLEDNHASSGTGGGSFSINMTGLMPDSTYYVKAYALFDGGVEYGNEVSFTTSQLANYTISLLANPANGGTVSGGGVFQDGQTCTVVAAANNGYSFVNWTEEGVQVSANTEYGFTVGSDRVLTANFTAGTYVISAASNPEEGGTISGAGGYEYGDNCTLTATANTGYVFEKWTENDTQVSTNATYTFSVSGSRSLVAHFKVQSYTISISANPQAGGVVSGGGTFEYGQSCILTATANSGYTFTNWTEGGDVVSSNSNYTFMVTGNRTLKANFTQQASQNYSISVSANPSDGGTVSGGGTYQQGQSCTVSAAAATGYTFLRWMENGSQVSANATYTFTVTGNRTLVAQFQVQNYTISVSATPSNGGSVTGGGSYNYGQSCTVVASTNNGYTFAKWTENGNQVSTNPSYTFAVNSNRTLVANFQIIPQAPTGAINGLFTVSSSRQVWFSQGNLQYNASADTWRFAAKQSDYIGSDNSNVSQTYSGWIDLFGWGTSGFNHGATYYQPWSTQDNYSGYYAYGNHYKNLYDETGQADWGYNAISNGGNNVNHWRTLSVEEWRYVLNTRNTNSGIRYAKANVDGVNGVILVPDNWNASTYSLNNYNVANAAYSTNTISASVWVNTFESAGAVFLPAGGKRHKTSISDVGSWGNYWSSSYSNDFFASKTAFSNSLINPETNEYRYDGCSVRLVYDLQ